MPRVIPKRARWRDDQIVVAWASLAAEQYVIRKGERLRGSDPRVVAHPDVFVEDGTPQSEWRSPGTGMRRSDHGKATDPKEPPSLRGGSPTVSQQPPLRIIENAPASSVEQALANAKGRSTQRCERSRGAPFC